jgi:hypothetical protein
MLSCKYIASTERDAGADDPIAAGQVLVFVLAGRSAVFSQLRKTINHLRQTGYV